MKPSHPYLNQANRTFWKKTVDSVYPLDIKDWYIKKFDISGKPIATAGSCFAQHIGRQLRELGFNYIDTEPAPRILAKDSWLDFGFGMYSALSTITYLESLCRAEVKAFLGRHKIPVVDLPKYSYDVHGIMLDLDRHENPEDQHHGNIEYGKMMIREILGLCSTENLQAKHD